MECSPCSKGYVKLILQFPLQLWKPLHHGQSLQKYDKIRIQTVNKCFDFLGFSLRLAGKLGTREGVIADLSPSFSDGKYDAQANESLILFNGKLFIRLLICFSKYLVLSIYYSISKSHDPPPLCRFLWSKKIDFNNI